MKRHGNLFEQIASFPNLLEAERSALRGKRSRSDPAAFHFDLEPNLFDFYAEGVAQHSPGSRQRTLGWHASTTIPKPQRGFTDIGPAMVSESRTQKRLPNRAIAPMWNPVGVRTGSVGRIVFPGCAIATLGFDVEPLRG